MSRSLRLSLALAILAMGVEAHVGSIGIYLDRKAGPYQLFVAIQPPSVIPGVAEVQVRCETPGVREMHAVPLPMSGAGARFAPVADKLAVSGQDPQFFTGSLWMMAPGSWEVRITVDGAAGRGELAIPVPSAALATKKMQPGLGLGLAVVMLFLLAGLAAMVGAAVREARLEPGMLPDSKQKRRGRIAVSIAFAVLIGVVWFGDWWWSSSDADYKREIYKPLLMDASLKPNGILSLKLHDPGWMNQTNPQFASVLFVRRLDDLIPDHGHLMHLYAIRQPGLDIVYHLHPELADPAMFRLELPHMPSGTYKLYADIVHANGFPETLVSTIQIPRDLPGRDLSGDDAMGAGPVLTRDSYESGVFVLPDGYRMQWLRTGAVRARQPTLFRFRLEDALGRAPHDMTLYMGMLGHAAFVKSDGSVFAHVHPTGSVPMASFMLAQQQISGRTSMASIDMPGMDMSGMDMPGMNQTGPAAPRLPNEVAFPYGLPTAGQYRVFVQMKHAQTIETGIFDLTAQ